MCVSVCMCVFVSPRDWKESGSLHSLHESQFGALEHLVPSCWHSLGKFKRFSPAGGGMGLGL